MQENNNRNNENSQEFNAQNAMTENQQAKQAMNQMYLNQTGAKVQKGVIEWFLSGTLFFQISSTIFSAFGFYYDFKSALGVIGAIVLGVGIGTFIEVSRHKSILGAFASFKSTNKALLGGIAFILMVIAISYHFKSLKNYENISVKADLTKQVLFERDTLLRNSKSIDGLIENNKELSKVLNNGKGGDDAIATNAMINNTDLMKALTALNGSTRATDLLMEQSTKTAKQTSNTLLLLFITMEFFAVFGIVGKVLLNSETDKNVKSIVTTADRINALESNVYTTVETAMINNALKRVNNYMQQQEQETFNPPTPAYAMTQNYQNQPNKAQIAFDANSGSNSYFTGIVSRFDDNREKPSFMPIINKRKPQTSGMRTETNTNQGENLKENLNNEEKEVLDLMKFDHKENELVKILWENGTVKKGDRLLAKRFVIPQLPRNITDRDLVNLYEKLIDYGMVEFKNGYRALVDIENVVTNKRIG